MKQTFPWGSSWASCILFFLVLSFLWKILVFMRSYSCNCTIAFEWIYSIWHQLLKVRKLESTCEMSWRSVFCSFEIFQIYDFQSKFGFSETTYKFWFFSSCSTLQVSRAETWLTVYRSSYIVEWYLSTGKQSSDFWWKTHFEVNNFRKQLLYERTSVKCC